ncbi:unnamed protein product [Amoebophrya sp. A25]|nr:unnamed protein product [Amoebophrya sp. A25]|eukprot:GSA25T00010082001.1
MSSVSTYYRTGASASARQLSANVERPERRQQQSSTTTSRRSSSHQVVSSSSATDMITGDKEMRSVSVATAIRNRSDVDDVDSPSLEGPRGPLVAVTDFYLKSPVKEAETKPAESSAISCDPDEHHKRHEDEAIFQEQQQHQDEAVTTATTTVASSALRSSSSSSAGLSQGLREHSSKLTQVSVIAAAMKAEEMMHLERGAAEECATASSTAASSTATSSTTGALLSPGGANLNNALGTIDHHHSTVSCIAARDNHNSAADVELLQYHGEPGALAVSSNENDIEINVDVVAPSSNHAITKPRPVVPPVPIPPLELLSASSSPSEERSSAVPAYHVDKAMGARTTVASTARGSPAGDRDTDSSRVVNSRVNSLSQDGTGRTTTGGVSTVSAPGGPVTSSRSACSTGSGAARCTSSSSSSGSTSSSLHHPPSATPRVLTPREKRRRERLADLPRLLRLVKARVDRFFHGDFLPDCCARSPVYAMAPTECAQHRALWNFVLEKVAISPPGNSFSDATTASAMPSTAPMFHDREQEAQYSCSSSSSSCSTSFHHGHAVDDFQEPPSRKLGQHRHSRAITSTTPIGGFCAALAMLAELQRQASSLPGSNNLQNQHLQQAHKLQQQEHQMNMLLPQQEQLVDTSEANHRLKFVGEDSSCLIVNNSTSREPSPLDGSFGVGEERNRRTTRQDSGLFNTGTTGSAHYSGGLTPLLAVPGATAGMTAEHLSRLLDGNPAARIVMDRLVELEGAGDRISGSAVMKSKLNRLRASSSRTRRHRSTDVTSTRRCSSSGGEVDRVRERQRIDRATAVSRNNGVEELERAAATLQRRSTRMMRHQLYPPQPSRTPTTTTFDPLKHQGRSTTSTLDKVQDALLPSSKIIGRNVSSSTGGGLAPASSSTRLATTTGASAGLVSASASSSCVDVMLRTRMWTPKRPQISFLDPTRLCGGFEALSLWSMKWRPVDIVEVLTSTKNAEQLVRVHYRGYAHKYDELIPDNAGRCPVRLRPCLRGNLFDQETKNNNNLHAEDSNSEHHPQLRDLAAEVRKQRQKTWRFVIPSSQGGKQEDDEKEADHREEWKSAVVKNGCRRNSKSRTSCSNSRTGIRFTSTSAPAAYDRKNRKRWSTQLDDLVKMFY